MGSEKRPRVLALVGPTGSGKSELAVRLARRVGAEIIGCDSMQVYRGMDIGTAKPSRALRAEIPHHAIDVTDPDDPMSAGRYAELARAAAHEILARGRRVILCGGTGLYARAFAGGLVSSLPSDPALRSELEARSTESLRAELEQVDPDAARRIAPADRVRTVRALELHRLGGAPASELREAHAFADRPFDVEWLALDPGREALAERIAERVDAMLRAGFPDEVRALRAAGYGPELGSMQAIGYREIGLVLEGRLAQAELRDAIVHATRRYAKRQRTWFRKEPGVRWVEPAHALRAALDLLT